MAKATLILEADKKVKGPDDYYRKSIEIEVKQDEEDFDYLAFNVDDTIIYVRKEDIKDIAKIYEL